jgi:starch synthase (maltosyl-transferring)
VACPTVFPLVVDRERARFSTWYEMFPRSAAPDTGRHGTFRDCEAWLPRIAQMGFDVLYFPPIHPIGRGRRKGRNNTLAAGPDDVGSPWAIGSTEGGHKAIHPALGTLADFRRLVDAARSHGLEIALDIAYQCAPDHPYVTEHPAWFRHRPDGSVQFAENPPKKYQDIYPFDFESDDWRGLWQELKSVLDFWIDQGVTIFRVDNPHTKAFAFWEWAIAEVKRAHPDVIFLSEAFTRPRVMHRLAKLGFTQSYTYFAWRNTKQELTDYFTELAHGAGREYFRPNAWPNTPDILTEYLQFGGRPAFMVRLVLAATLAASYGIYGPAYEAVEAKPREPGSEEYLDSEKYELRAWALDRPDSIAGFIARVNRVRRENAALQSDAGLRFHGVDNESMICFSKGTDSADNVVLTVVNLDPYNAQSGWVELDLAALGLDPATPYQMHELLSDARYLWTGARNYVRLDPARAPAHVFRLRRRVRTERDFDYFL